MEQQNVIESAMEKQSVMCLTLSAVARLDRLHALILARRANAEHTAAYIDAHREDLSAERLAALQQHLDQTLASLDAMDAEYARMGGSPCTDELPNIQ